MFRRVPFYPLAWSLLVLFPAPFFALLCRGHSPSRLETINLPVWERRPPSPAPPCRLFRLTPPPAGTVQVLGNPWLDSLQNADENQLLAAVEHPGSGDAAKAGLWLEAACAWGRAPQALADKQDRTATRLMTAQGVDGSFGRRISSCPWTPAEAKAQQGCLRGLLAYFALTHRPAAIYAALMTGNRILPLVSEIPDPGWTFPLARLTQETDDQRFLAAACREAARSDGLGLCALYEATGQAAYLAQAHLAWTQAPSSSALAAELLLLTGRPGYAAALDRLPASGPDLARAGWTRMPLGIAINTVSSSAAVFGGVKLKQQTGKIGRTILVETATPKAFKLRVYLPIGPPSQIQVNGFRQTVPAPPGGYAMLLRRWRNGDVVTIITHSSNNKNTVPRA
jgi:hypothetical protein